MSTELPVKRCSKCGQVKALDEFSAHPRTSDGRHCWCRACQREKSREWHFANRDKHLAQMRAWRAAHPAEIAAYKASRRKKQREQASA